MAEQWSWEMVGASRVEWTLPNTSKGESLVTTHPSDPLGIVGPKMFSRQAPKSLFDRRRSRPQELMIKLTFRELLS